MEVGVCMSICVYIYMYICVCVWGYLVQTFRQLFFQATMKGHCSATLQWLRYGVGERDDTYVHVSIDLHGCMDRWVDS